MILKKKTLNSLFRIEIQLCHKIIKKKNTCYVKGYKKTYSESPLVLLYEKNFQ